MLTPREYQVVTMMLSGLTTSEIKTELNLAAPTVSNAKRRALDRIPGLGDCLTVARDLHRRHRRPTVTCIAAA